MGAAEKEVRKANKRSRNDSVTTEAGKRARKESEAAEESAIAPEIISAALSAPAIEKTKKAKNIEATSEDITADTVQPPKKGKKRKEESPEASATEPEVMAVVE